MTKNIFLFLMTATTLSSMTVMSSDSTDPFTGISILAGNFKQIPLNLQEAREFAKKYPSGSHFSPGISRTDRPRNLRRKVKTMTNIKFLKTLAIEITNSNGEAPKTLFAAEAVKYLSGNPTIDSSAHSFFENNSLI